MRWDLPLFLFSLLLPTPRPAWRVMNETMNVSADVALSPRGTALLAEAAAAVKRGVQTLALQSSPHLTLVQPSYYRSELKPLVAHWAILWITSQRCMTGDLARAKGLPPPASVEAHLLAYVAMWRCYLASYLACCGWYGGGGELTGLPACG